MLRSVPIMTRNAPIMPVSIRNLVRLLWQLTIVCSLFTWSAAASAASQHVSDSVANMTVPFYAATIEGDIVIGGLFPVHEKGEKGCGAISTDRGIERLEAMLFTIDEINKNEDILPGIKLGASAYDTCGRAPYALEQSLEFIRASITSLDSEEFYCSDGSKATAKQIPTAVAGVIGGSYSTVSIQVANLLRLFKIPQISYASTSAALSDKTRYDYFVRTVPPDTLQAKALVDIVQEFNWTYVSVVHSEGEYGESGTDFFKREARSKNICVAADIKISITATNATYDQVIVDLQEKPEASVVIVFVRIEDATGLLNAASRKNLTGKFVWVASDAWGNRIAPVKNNPLVAQGAITLELQSNPITKFEQYFLNLNPRTNKRNPWFVEYWEEEHNCNWNSGATSMDDPGSRAVKPPCRGNERLSRKITSQESKVQFIYDAVYALAHALDNMHRDLCPELPFICKKMEKIDGEKLLKEYLLNVSFNDGYGAHVSFDEQGDAPGRYMIMNYQKNRTSRDYEYHVIGKWNSKLSVNRSQIIWPGETKEIPRSRCSEPCKEGEIKNMQRGDVCCWICTRCNPWEYIKDEKTCESCAEGLWPYPNKTGCFELEVQYMVWTSIHAIIPMALATLGIMSTCFVISLFVMFNSTPVVMASGRELSYMLLSGCALCYFMTFILIAPPTTILCAFQRFGVGFGFSIIYSSLLIKTNRISRIFESARRSAKRPPFISPKSQIVMTCVLILIQVLFTFVWLLLEPPGTRFYYPDSREPIVIKKCKSDDISFLVSLIYNMLLIIICTVYAVKTRNIPENFNESKFIGFSMYTTCIIWLAFVPIYFGTLNSFRIQVTTLCVSISLSASVALLCLFLPKVYIIVFQPQKNVRKLTVNSASYKTAPSLSTGTGNNHSANNSNLSQRESFIKNHYQQARTDENSVCSLSIHKSPSPAPSSEHVRLTIQPLITITGTTTETETDRDSLASL